MTNKEAVNAIKCNYPPSSYSMLREALDMSISLLEQGGNERWIPVNERLPDEHEEVRDIYDVESLALVDTENFSASDLVLVTVKDNEKDELFVSDDVIVNGKWSNFGVMDTFNVIAWKPMPEAYIGE
uniref:hypothetical protein n=1 Tax=Clostridium sp. 12(A) TaxID=1163671 RepID=UPI0004631768|nr:hypothetical protein [Clostridium sp. 12(A)]